MYGRKDALGAKAVLFFRLVIKSVTSSRHKEERRQRCLSCTCSRDFVFYKYFIKERVITKEYLRSPLFLRSETVYARCSLLLATTVQLKGNSVAHFPGAKCWWGICARQRSPEPSGNEMRVTRFESWPETGNRELFRF
jgi:hypothetical protein